MSKSMDISELAFPVKDLLRPFAGDTKTLRECTEQLDDLCNVIIVLAVFRAGLRVEQVVACDEFKNLLSLVLLQSKPSRRDLTMQAILHTSVLAPHFAPRITSGERYCRV